MTGREITLRDYIEKVVSDRDKMCNTRMEAFNCKVEALFNSLEKAISKAESAQRDYNERSNEFRGQLDDQAKTLMPRHETQLLVKTLDDKIEGLRDDVVSLREARTGNVARVTSHQEMWAYLFGVFALLVSVASFVVHVVR